MSEAPSFQIGANLPWLHYGHDFGTAWTHSGVSHPQSKARISRAFQQASDAGATFIRWFLFADGRALGIDLSKRAGLPEVFFDDVGCALDLAQQYRLNVVFVLFDYQWFKAPYVHKGVQLFGRASWLSEEERARTFDTFVSPLLRRIENHPALWLIELMNEPEWLLPEQALVEQALDLDFLFELLRFLGDSVRGQSPSLKLTLGCAHSRWLSLWKILELDVRQVHHYEGQLPPGPGLLLGEFSSASDVGGVLHQAEALGYRAAAPWALLSDDEHTDSKGMLAGMITHGRRTFS